MTNYRNKQNYRFRTWKFRDRCHLKCGVRQGCFLSLILNYLIQFIHFHSSYIMSHYYAKFKENSCVGTDASTPFNFLLVGFTLLSSSRVFLSGIKMGVNVVCSLLLTEKHDWSFIFVC